MNRTKNIGLGAVLLSLLLVFIIIPIGPLVISAVISEGLAIVPSVLAIWALLLLLFMGAEGGSEILLLIVISSVASWLISHAFGCRAEADGNEVLKELQNRIDEQRSHMENEEMRNSIQGYSS